MHAVRIDEIMLRRGQPGVIRIINPPVPAHEETALGRPFGFVSFALPRSPQIEAIAAEIERVIERAYREGTLRTGQTAEQFFEETAAKVRAAIAAETKEQRLKLDYSLITIALGAVCGNEIYLTRHGQAEAYLVRRKPGAPVRTADIFRGMDSVSESILSDLVVGNLEPDDLLLVASAKLFDAFPVADIVEAIGHTEPAAVASRIRSLLLSGTGADTLAGCLVRLSEVRAMFRAKENQSVNALRSREEEVARTLSPAGIPGIGAILTRIKKSPAPGASPRTQLPKLKTSSPIERFNSWPRASKLSAAALLAALAILFVSLQIRSMGLKRAAAESAFAAQADSIKQKLTDAESTQIYDENRARAIVAEAQAALDKLPNSTKPQAAAHEEIAASIKAMNRRLDHLFDVTPKVAETVDGVPSIILKVGDGYLTNAGPNLLLIGANGSSTNVATLPDSPLWAAPAGDQAGTVFLWLKNGTLVSLAAGTKGSIPKALDYSGPENPRAGAIWNGNLYAVSSDGKQIAKLPPTMTGFGRGKDWLAAPLSAPAMGTAIDGSVYTPIAGDAVRKFEKGKMTAFSAAGASANAAPVAFFLGAEKLYLLGGDGTLAAWDKSGKLLAQYVIAPSAGKPVAFAVDEQSNVVTLATDKSSIVNFSMTK